MGSVAGTLPSSHLPPREGGDPRGPQNKDRKESKYKANPSFSGTQQGPGHPPPPEEDRIPLSLDPPERIQEDGGN